MLPTYLRPLSLKKRVARHSELNRDKTIDRQDTVVKIIGKCAIAREPSDGTFNLDYKGTHTYTHDSSTPLQHSCTSGEHYTLYLVYAHVLMRDERRKEERSKQGQTKQ